MTRFIVTALALAAVPVAVAARSEPADAHGRFAKLIVTVSGDSADYDQYGWLWDAGERRNGRPFVGTSGTLGGNPPSGTKGSNHLIYYWITDEGWPGRIGPTESEILDTIGGMGWDLVAVDHTAFHERIPVGFNCDRSTTYYFASRRR